MKSKKRKKTEIIKIGVKEWIVLSNRAQIKLLRNKMKNFMSTLGKLKQINSWEDTND